MAIRIVSGGQARITTPGPQVVRVAAALLTGVPGATGPMGAPSLPTATTALSASTTLTVGAHAGRMLNVTTGTADDILTLPATGSPTDAPFMMRKIDTSSGRVIVRTSAGTDLAWLFAGGDWVQVAWWDGAWRVYAHEIAPWRQLIRATVSNQPTPPLASTASITVRAGGGGGAGGASGAAGTVRRGGGGGAAGSVRRTTIARIQLGSTWQATIGAGGAGGAAGASGGDGGTSEFRSGTLRVFVVGIGTKGLASGNGGLSIAAAVAGEGPAAYTDSGGYGGTASATGGGPTGSPLGRGGYGGGGAGGGVTAANVSAAGATSTYNDVVSAAIGGAAGTGADGGPGDGAAIGVNIAAFGAGELTAGGAGGGGSTSGIGGAGGNGYDGGGGGGGGGGTTGGAGGAGGDGLIAIIWSF